MYGAIAGDIIGSYTEFAPIKTKDFPLFRRASRFTDDTVMTVALADGLMKTTDIDDEQDVKTHLVKSMVNIGRRYPNCGYGGRFFYWVLGPDHSPYNSFGNGSAMRVSPVAWVMGERPLEDCLRLARWTAEISHNHSEGIKGAMATAGAQHMALNGYDKEDIRAFLTGPEIGYDLTRTLDEIRPTYEHVETCQDSVPEALTCFLEGTSYEDTVRNAISLGGDADTQAAIAGAVAEAYFGMPTAITSRAVKYLTDDLYKIVLAFDKKYM